MYAVMGVTGKVGGAAARRLRGMDLPVRAVLRDERKRDTWRELGCEVAVADFAEPADLAAAFRGCEAVFVMLPPIFDPSPGFAEAAGFIATLRLALTQAKPERIVALSSIGAEAPQPNLLNSLGHLELALGSLPIPVTFLRAAWFMENALWDIPGARNGTIQSYLQPLDHRVAMICAEDVGGTAATLLQDRWIGTRAVELEAAQRVSPNDIAQAFSHALGLHVSAEAVPRERWESLFRSQGMRNPTPRMQMLDGFNAGWIDFAHGGAGTLKGSIDVDQAIAQLVRTTAS